ncbi:Ribonuclease/ribotoxin [Coprinopsis sp. MPI-PUGE-AT-0042]|nr:Ribonuclease/ribotoxin [Coprinopsis sp. MPI-PUGE-AT-0042]
MAYLKACLIFALVAFGPVLPLAIAIQPDHANEHVCRNSAYPGGQFVVKRPLVHSALRAVRGIMATGKSGYPHEFGNNKGTRIEWPGASKRCLTETLWEYPILLDGSAFPFDVKRTQTGGQSGGPARLIYTKPTPGRKQAALCGVIAHIDGNKGPLELCTTRMDANRPIHPPKTPEQKRAARKRTKNRQPRA